MLIMQTMLHQHTPVLQCRTVSVIFFSRSLIVMLQNEKFLKWWKFVARNRNETFWHHAAVSTHCVEHNFLHTHLKIYRRSWVHVSLETCPQYSSSACSSFQRRCRQQERTWDSAARDIPCTCEWASSCSLEAAICFGSHFSSGFENSLLICFEACTRLAKVADWRRSSLIQIVACPTLRTAQD